VALQSQVRTVIATVERKRNRLVVTAVGVMCVRRTRYPFSAIDPRKTEADG